MRENVMRRIGDTQREMRGFFTWLLKFGISLGLAVWLLSKVEFAQLSQQWKQTDWLIVMLLTPLVYLWSVCFMALRSKIILSRQGIIGPVWFLILMHLKSAFLSILFAGPIPGDIYRTFVLSKGTNKSLESFSSVLMERAMGVLTLLLVSLVAVYYSGFVVGVAEFKSLMTLILSLTGVFSGVCVAVILMGYFDILDRVRVRGRFWSSMQRLFKTVPQHFSNVMDLFKFFALLSR